MESNPRNPGRGHSELHDKAGSSAGYALDVGSEVRKMSIGWEMSICAMCRFGPKSYGQLIGVLPWCCERNCHCEPGRLASDYMPKDDDGKEEGTR